MTNVTTEVWKDVVGAVGKYQVSNYGRVRKTPKVNSCGFEYGGGIMSMQVNDYIEYCHLSLRMTPSDSKTYFAHVLVAEAFLSPRPEWAECVNHKNGIKTDNRPENLEWATYTENVQHAVDIGLLPIRSGENHHNAKLNTESVRSMRSEYLSETITNEQLAHRYGVSPSIVNSVLRYRHWGEVDPDNKEWYVAAVDAKKRKLNAHAAKKRNPFGVSKLTNEQVLEIRRMWVEDQPLTKRKIAERFNIHESTCADIINRKIHNLI